MEGIYFQSPLIILSPSEAILQPPWGLPTLRLWITDMENRKSITILHPWPSPPLFFPLYCSGTVWEPSYTCSWPHFPCGWHNLLPLHCVFLYGGLFPHRLSHTPVSGKWHVVWHGSKLHKWVGYAQEHEGILETCLLVLWNTLKGPLCGSDFMLWNEKRATHCQRKLWNDQCLFNEMWSSIVPIIPLLWTEKRNRAQFSFLVDHI